MPSAPARAAGAASPPAPPPAGAGQLRRAPTRPRRPARRPRARPRPARAAAAWAAPLALLAILAGALALRLVALDHGLPYVFNPDEALHFTNRAVAMFGHGLDPHYFQNPSAFTYLVHLALRLRFTAGWPLGSSHDLVAGFARDPTARAR